MRTKRIQRLLRWLAAIISIWPLVSATAAPAVYAQHARTVRHAPDRMYEKMPPGHKVVHLGKFRYYVHGGAFYVKKPPGFVEVRAPLGAIVIGLPIGAMALLIGGITYYVYNDVCYRKVPEGYAVVERPSEVFVVKETSAVVLQIRRHEVLVVHGYAPDWLCVKMPNGSFGWVMLKFTRAHESNAVG